MNYMLLEHFLLRLFCVSTNFGLAVRMCSVWGKWGL